MNSDKVVTQAVTVPRDHDPFACLSDNGCECGCSECELRSRAEQSMSTTDHWYGYPFRSLFRFVYSGETGCASRWCGRARVGLSHYCRRHTDEILHGRVTDDR